MECVDERLFEAFDVVIVRRAHDKGEGHLGLHKEIFCVLGGGHGSDNKGDKEGAQW